MNMKPENTKPRFNLHPRLRRALKITVIAVGAAFALDLAVVVGFSVWHPPVQRADAVIVLGAKVGTPALTNRALKGLELYRTSHAGALVLSGGRGAGEPVSEAQAMRRVIEDEVAKTKGAGLPTMILEQTSRNTYENIRNSRALIPKARSVVVVSDCFHLARATFVAIRAGFGPVYWDAPRPTYYQPPDLALLYLRETVGIITYLPRLITG
jgi:uncharacterized SAM-binding protein YcdF (DUF218 family)